MKLTDKDKEYLLEKIYGGVKQTFEEDLPQIEAAADVTIYSLNEDGGEGQIIHVSSAREISRATAIRLCGRKGWLASLVRAAFHWTACREVRNRPNAYVMFDAHPLFRDFKG